MSGLVQLRAYTAQAGQALLEAPPKRTLSFAAAMIALIALLDRSIASNLSLGVLYAIPIMIASPTLKPWHILMVALGCTLLREQFSSYSWEPHAISRLSTAFSVFAGAGLFVREVARGRRMAMQLSQELKEQHERREEAEHQLKILIESSPAAIMTVDAGGLVDIANLAAHQLLAVHADSLHGTHIRDFLPMVDDLLKAAGDNQPYRSATTCRGRRANGESFLACVWFATYPTRAGQRLAAIITDSSEDLRDWQETSLQSLLRSTRVLVGSVSHEIRNICAAISVVHANLGRLNGVAQTEDYAALGTLAQGLTRLATMELHAPVDHDIGSVSLDQLLDEYRIVISPSLDMSEVELCITAQENLPHVLGDRHGLLQVLLNLSRNSIRAMEESPHKLITLDARCDDEGVLLRFSDSGAGVHQPDLLFQPFQQGAEDVGLGLFVSRAIVRACCGELYYEASDRGCTMCLKLKISLVAEAAPEAQDTEISA